ncbi:MAG: tetratricopeptide repeat protein [Planctomycetota bacterium]
MAAAPDPTTPLLVALVALALVAVIGFAFVRQDGGAAGPASNDPKELLAEGRRVGKTQRLEDALPFFRKAAALAPQDAEVQLVLGRALHLLDRPEEAIPALEKVTRLAPEGAEAWRLLGICYTLLEKHDLAEKALVEALRRAPDDVEPHYYLGVGAQERRQPARVIEHFRAYLASSKNERRRPVALRLLAQAQLQLGDERASIASLESLVALEPADVSVQLTLQQLRVKALGYEPTLAAARAAVQKGGHPIQPFLLAQLLAEDPGHHAEADAAYTDAIARAPSALPPHVERIRLALGDLRLGDAERLVSQVPNPLQAHPEVELVRAELRRLQGRYPEAEEGYRKLLARKGLPLGLIAAAQRGILGAKTEAGEGEEALSYVRSLFAFAEPGDPRHQLEAETLERLGRFDEAAAIYARLLEKGRPQDRPLWLGLRGYLLLDADRVADARVGYEELLAAADQGQTPAPPELCLWAGVALAQESPARAEALWKTGGRGPRQGKQAWQTLACARLLGEAEPALLEAAGRVAGWAALNDVAYVEGLALQRAGKAAEAKAAWERGLAASRGEEFPARLIRRALGK